MYDASLKNKWDAESIRQMAMDMAVEDIVQATGLSAEEIEELK